MREFGAARRLDSVDDGGHRPADHGNFRRPAVLNRCLI
jgi:hypothetical protein